MEKKLKMLFVEDVIRDAELIWRELEKSKILFEKVLVDNKKDYICAMKSFNPEIIMSDYSMPQFDGMQALILRNEYTPFTPFILVTGSINEEVAVECMKAGADDYILKDNLSRLGPAIINSFKKIELLKLKKDAETALRESEERFRILYNEAVVGLYRTNLKGEIFLANDTLVKMLGFNSFEELAARNLKEAGYGPSYNRQQFIDQIEKEGVVNNLEAIWVCYDGKEIFVRESAKAICGSDGTILYYDGTVEDITDKKLAEEKLHESEERYRLLVEKSPDAIALHYEGKWIFINSAGARLVGAKSPQELIGRYIIDVIHPDSRKKVVDRLRQVTEGKEALPMEEKFVKLDGSVIDVEIIGIPITYQGLKAGQVIVRDITERKITQENLRNSEGRLKILFDYAPDAYYLSDLKGTFLDGNIAAEKLLGHNKDELIGKSFLKLNLLSLKQIPQATKLLVKNALGQSTGPDEFELTLKDGSKVIVEIITHPVKIKDQTLVLGIARDISERKAAEDALRESEEKFRSIMENSADAIFITDQKGKYLYTNKAVTVMLGYSSEEMKKKNILDITPKNEMEKYLEIFNKALVEGKVFAEIELLKKDGNFIFTDLNSVILPGGLVYGSCRDITERKKAEELLKYTLVKAEESDRLKTAFLHNISHEIRTPMNAIVGFAALLGEPGLDTQTQQSYVETITKSSDHLLSIVTDIIDISNIEANIVNIAKNDINVNVTLKSLCNQFLQTTRERKIKLVCESGLSDSDALVITDSTKLTQVLTNLIGNAIKFTDEGSVKVAYGKEDSFLKFSVSDTGIGIPAEYHEKIFDRFFQVQNTISRIYEGTGLGLAISKAYVDLMGGNIWVSSQPGKGTTFTFTIPYKKQIIAEEPLIVKSVPEASSVKRKIKILVAEDIDSNFKLLTYFLQGTNTEIIRATNGKEAVEKCLAGNNIDLILMDIKMPEMDGYTATRLIREANITIPIIAQTAYADDSGKAIAGGCNGFISKPFNKENLLKVLYEFI